MNFRNIPDTLKAFISIAHTAGDGSVGTPNRLWVGRYTSPFLEGVKIIFSLVQIFQTGSLANPVGTGFFPKGKSDRSVKYATQLHHVPRLGICGALPL